MEWVLRSPQIQSIFSNLGCMRADGYHVNDNCNAALETILHNILTEDKYCRTYRRIISLGQNIKKDLIPLLIHAKEDKTIGLLIRILAHLSEPIECLLSVEVTSQSEFGSLTIFEINQLLTATKAAFTGLRATKVVIEYLKKNVEPKVSPEQCTNICNSLLLLRNILYIPEDAESPVPGNNGSGHAVQNQIIWNMFSQSIDKVLIKLMTIPEATNWGVPMVQVIALLYKDQHVVTLQKLLNMWCNKSCNSESSEENESNTSSPDRGREDSSPMLTSDPTSDSSADSANDFHMRDQVGSTDDENMKSDNGEKVMPEDSPTAASNKRQRVNVEKKGIISDNSDCGHRTRIQNQESISTSSSDIEILVKRKRKPRNYKRIVNTKARTGITLQEKKRKKIVKRGITNIINIQGLTHQTPTDDDISNVLKEFTIDFLLKGYNPLVQSLHSQIVTDVLLEIDTSHFFWLVTYFLKFATQVELGLKHISAVLSFDIVSYLTAEGVNLCEQFELAVKLGGNDLGPSSRRLHLVVTAIREFVQAIEVYKKFPQICADDKETLIRLQNKMCETDELKSLLVLLLRHYDPKYHSKQYLQDLIVTNHILLTFVDGAMRHPDYSGSPDMADHIKQFATPAIMNQYGLLLEGYSANGEFLNDCAFTILHHVGGELDTLPSLYQPRILKAFTSIWKSEFEVCDDWSDLIQYVINTFMKKHSAADVGHEKTAHSSASQSSIDGWTKDELSCLSWNYLQSNTHSDIVSEILKRLKENVTVKSRESIIRELYKQNIINKEGCEKLSKSEVLTDKVAKMNKETKRSRMMNEDVQIGKICEQLRQDGKAKCFDWVQQVLLETCYAKMQIEKRCRDECGTAEEQSAFLLFKLSNKQLSSPVMSPVSYHALLLNQSVPLVPWNCEQAAMCKDLKFLQLLHKLGFQMPVDTGKVFIRIPHVWSAAVLYEVAGRLATIDTRKVKFSVSDITTDTNRIGVKSGTRRDCALPLPPARAAHAPSPSGAPDCFQQTHEQNHVATVTKTTPKPGSPMPADRPVEGNNRCWLEVVQRARELKLTCTVGSVLEEVKKLAESTEPAAQQAAPAPAPGLPEVKVMPPEDFIAELSELEDDSVSETAYVASDLTHMYVSDEDEKSEPAVRPSVTANAERAVVDGPPDYAPPALRPGPPRPRAAAGAPPPCSPPCCGTQHGATFNK